MEHAAPRRTGRVVRLAWTKRPTRFFHGTSSDRMPFIRAKGLQSPVYLADSVELAASYGATMCRNGAQVVVLEVSGLDPDRLRPDENASHLPVNCADSCFAERNRIIREESLPSARSHWTAPDAWPLSWATVGSVIYDGTVRNFKIVLED